MCWTKLKKLPFPSSSSFFLLWILTLTFFGTFRTPFDQRNWFNFVSILTSCVTNFRNNKVYWFMYVCLHILLSKQHDFLDCSHGLSFKSDMVQTLVQIYGVISAGLSYHLLATLFFLFFSLHRRFFVRKILSFLSFFLKIRFIVSIKRYRKKASNPKFLNFWKICYVLVFNFFFLKYIKKPKILKNWKNLIGGFLKSTKMKFKNKKGKFLVWHGKIYACFIKFGSEI